MTAKNTSSAATTVAKKAGDDLSPATEAAASGAIIEPGIADASVIDHPAADANPREGTPPESNQIDFNMPSAIKPQEEQVAEKLAAGE